MISPSLTLQQAQDLLPGLSWMEWKQLRPGSVVCRAIEIAGDHGKGWHICWCLHVEGPQEVMISYDKSYDSHAELERAAALVSERLGVPIVRKYGGFDV